MRKPPLIALRFALRPQTLPIRVHMAESGVQSRRAALPRQGTAPWRNRVYQGRVRPFPAMGLEIGQAELHRCRDGLR